ncbi:MAG: extracellular solute-binding protein [bacterium]|nr:extracellular solute-binding protein [bacterium]
MKKRKKVLATMLAVTMAVTCLSACGQTPAEDNTSSVQEGNPSAPAKDSEQTPTEENRVSFTVTSTHSQNAMDYDQDPLYKYISDLFQFDYEVWPVSKDSHDEKVRMWINGGTMPDILCWRNFNYQEYVSYAEQGLLKPLPEGWEETYPEIYKMYQVCGIYDKMAVDGVYYGIPHSTYYRFAEMDAPVLQHATLYYRKDWAEDLGFHFGASVTMSDLADYLKACIENDKAGNGKTLGLSEAPAAVDGLFMLPCGYDTDEGGFYRDETGYHWILDNGKISKGIELAREWYAAGLIDPDYYLLNNADATANFTSGLSAAMYNSCSVPSHYVFRDTFEETTGLSANCIGLAAIADENTVYANQTNNYWSCTFFSPSLDDETYSRILKMIDWCCSEEGELTIMVGLRGEAWDYNEDGSIKILLEPDADGNYKSTADLCNSYQVFRSLGVVADDYSFINPAYDANVVQQILDVFEAKKGAEINYIDYDYKFFSSDAKAEYSVDIHSELTKLIITPGIDVDAELADFIKDTSGLWQPVVNDLNAAFVK